VRAFVEVVRVRACFTCGVDVIRLPDDYDTALLDAVPVLGVDAMRQVGPGRVAWGWAFTGRYWRVHNFTAAPDIYAFLAHTCASSTPPPEGQRAMTNSVPDPFSDSEGRPAVSFKDAPVGTVIVCTIDAAPKLVHARNFETGQPDYWPDGNAKQTAVVDVKVDGEDKSLWAAKPSALYGAITEAVKKAGQQLAPGGTLSVRYYADKPNANPRLNPQKLYQAHYEPPSAFAGDDPWAPSGTAEPAAATPAPVAPATPAPTPAATPAAPVAAAPPWAQ
jgi:hypothetical protein